MNIFIFISLVISISNVEMYSLYEYDFVIIGCGTSGAIIASRLSENPNFKVACIERGPNDYPNSTAWSGMTIPDGINFYSPHDPIILSPHESGKKSDYIPRAMGIGGTSKIYGMFNVRPHSDALASWPKGWQYNDFLPYFKKIEDHYCYYDKDSGISKEECELYHGKNGPLQVNGMDINSFHNLSKSFKELCDDITQPWNGYSSDYNGNPNKFTGCTPLQQFKDRLNRTDPKSPLSRANSKTGYLKKSVIDRKNLKIFVDSPATRIIFNEEKKAIGVEIFEPLSNSIKRLNVRKEVILSAGAFHTPQLLQVSGVGDKELLKKINVPLVVDNPYVGKHLWDHISLHYVVELNVCDNLFHQINGPSSWMLFYNSGIRKEISKNFREIQLNILDASDGRTTPLSRLYLGTKQTTRCDNNTGTIATFRITHNYNDFRNGTVEATTNSIFDKPIINLGLKKLSETDRNSLKSAIELLRSHAMNKNKSFGKLIKNEILPGSQNLDDYLDNNIGSALHPVGSCGMGSCIDENLNVIGTKSLKVCDASSFPTQIDANPSATIYAMAEMLSDKLLKQYSINDNKNNWQVLDDMIIYKNNDILPRKKVAVFDLTSLMTFIKNNFELINRKLNDLYFNGYNIVLFSRKLTLCDKQEDQIKIYNNDLIETIKLINVPIQIYTSICDDENYLDVLWNRFIWLDNDGIDIDYKSSIYVANNNKNLILSKLIPIKYLSIDEMFLPTNKLKHFEISQSIKLNRPADDVWNVIGDFFKIDKWHPDIIEVKSDTSLRRHVLFPGQLVNTIEQLIHYDPEEYIYKYKNVGGNWGKDVQNYVSTLKILNDNNGQSCIVIWSGSYDALNESGITKFYRNGLDALINLFLNTDPCLNIEMNFNNSLSKFINSNLHIYWRQEYNVSAKELWKYVGVWKGTKNGTLSYEPGAEYSFILPSTPRIYERLVYYDDINLEFYYCMRITYPRSLPAINYLSMKKVVQTSNSTSAWIRTGQMITDGSTTVDAAAYQVLNDVYVAGGERLRVQLNNS